MRSFPAAFEAQKNLLTGASPVWIFKFSANGIDYYLSDNAINVDPWSVTTLPWMQSWGQVQAGISGTLNSYKVDNLDLSILIDTSVSPNMETLVTSYPIESSPVSLYLWFIGCADPPQEFFRGYIEDLSIPDETTVQLVLQDETLRLERAMTGERVTRVVYPAADPDDVNKLIPIPFGTVSRLPSMAVNAGIQTTLPTGITAAATSFSLTDGFGLAVNIVVQVDAEQIKILGIAGDSVTSCTRGFNSTVAAVHQKAAIVWERKTSFDYIAAGVPVGSIPKVRATLGGEEVDITSVCTRYTGQTGSVHASYPGKAVVTIPGYITASQAIDLLATGGLTLSQATDVVNALGVNNGLTVSTVIAISEALHTHTGVLGVIALPMDSVINLGGTISSIDSVRDGNKSTYATLTAGAFAAYRIQPQIGLGTPTRFRLGLLVHGVGTARPTVGGAGLSTYSFSSPSAPNVILTNWETFTSWANLQTAGNNTYALISWTSGTLLIYDIWWEVEYDPTPATAAATINGNGAIAGTIGGSIAVNGTSALATAISGNPTISGNSTANTLVGSQILCDVVALKTSITDVFEWILADAGYTGTFSKVGAWPGSYVFCGAITDYRSALFWLNDLAFQSRAWFKLSRGVASLIYRPDTLTSVKTLATCRISGGKKIHSRKKTSYDEILNTVSIAYARDWSKPAGTDAYQKLVNTGPDSDSVGDYGPRERPELFRFDFVTDDTMAANLQAFYLAWYKDRHWLHESDTFLYDSELEFGDDVTLGFSDSAVGQIMDTQIAPGDSARSDMIGMVVVV